MVFLKTQRGYINLNYIKRLYVKRDNLIYCQLDDNSECIVKRCDDGKDPEEAINDFLNTVLEDCIDDNCI